MIKSKQSWKLILVLAAVLLLSVQIAGADVSRTTIFNTSTITEANSRYAISPAGILYKLIGTDLYNSVDNGTTYSLVANGVPPFTSISSIKFVNESTFYVSTISSPAIWKTVTGGTAFTDVYPNRNNWSWDINTNSSGEIFVTTYSTTAGNHVNVSKSATGDAGDWSNDSQPVFDMRHIHGSAMCGNDNYYVAIGDLNTGYNFSNVGLWRLNTKTDVWTQLLSRVQVTSVQCINNATYFGSDGKSGSFYSSDDTNYNKITPRDDLSFQYIYHTGYDDRNSILYMQGGSPTRAGYSQLWASPDLMKTIVYLIPLVDDPVSTYRIMDKPTLNDLFFIRKNSTTSLKYNALTHAELQYLAYPRKSITLFSNDTNLEQYGGEDGTEYNTSFTGNYSFQFLTNPLRNAVITVTGINTTNMLRNSSFEEGNSSWNNESGNWTVSTSKAHTGIYSMGINVTDGLKHYLSQNAYNNESGYIPQGTNIEMSGWIRYNSTNATGNGVIIYALMTYNDSTTGSMDATYSLPGNDTQWWYRSAEFTATKPIRRIQFYAQAQYNGSYYIDDAVIRWTNGSNLTYYSSFAYPYTDSNGTYNTKNTSLTFMGSTHINSSLDNSSSVNFSVGEVYGIQPIYFYADGSKVANISISGETLMNCDNCLINYSGGKYVFLKTYSNPAVNIFNSTSIELNTAVKYNISNISVTVGSIYISPSAWVNLTINKFNTSGDYQKELFVSSQESSNLVNFAVGDNLKNNRVQLLIDNINYGNLLSDSEGRVSFSISTWSDHTIILNSVPNKMVGLWDFIEEIINHTSELIALLIFFFVIAFVGIFGKKISKQLEPK